MDASLPVPFPAPRPAAFAQRAAARLTGSPWFWAIFVATVFTLPLVRSISRSLPALPPVLGSLPEIAMTDLAGRELTRASLTGRVVLLELTSASRLATDGSPLAALRHRVRNTGDAVALVSLVEGGLAPEVAARVSAGPSRWILAAGETRSFERRLALLSGLPEDTPLAGRLFLVDRGGRLRRVTGTSPAEIDTMIRDLGLILNVEEPAR